MHLTAVRHHKNVHKNDLECFFLYSPVNEIEIAAGGLDAKKSNAAVLSSSSLLTPTQNPIYSKIQL